ncbi:hypothetical protein CQW49_24030 (plasmid) [Methylosinus trichosporium OB3b]|uniref:Uncharacterized protein n=2 Tax=Methylocystaceae TaxID=31993 RepID=A0A2D2D851_METT3|nr:hypothetical protein CQW49_24030 [Methylosinus trichosporium OB3b]OBS50676.1 hypothetical protein A8B73_20380 [Methylosinus sp. 3S-1]
MEHVVDRGGRDSVAWGRRAIDDEIDRAPPLLHVTHDTCSTAARWRCAIMPPVHPSICAAPPLRAAQSRRDDRFNKFPHGKVQNCSRLFVLSKRDGGSPAEGEVQMASSSLNVPSAASKAAGVTQVFSQDEVCVGAAWPGRLRTQALG